MTEKILILSVPRAGSSKLTDILHRADQSYLKLAEPFNREAPGYIADETRWKLDQNMIVKTVPVDTSYGPELNQDLYLEFILDVSKYFNKFIILKRRNKKEHWESWLNLHKKMSNNQDSYQAWNINELKGYNPGPHINYEDTINPSNRICDNFSLEKNIPITYYEDLYSYNRDKSKEEIKKWKLSDKFTYSHILMELTNPKYRSRQDLKKPLI